MVDHRKALESSHLLVRTGLAAAGLSGAFAAVGIIAGADWQSSLTALAVAGTSALAAGAGAHRLHHRALVGLERSEALERLASLTGDEVTGLLSRRAFVDAAEQALLRRPPSERLALHLIDIDHLKALTDNHGRGAGDEALRHVADMAATLFPGAIAGRLGGDEIAVLAPCPDPETAAADAERLLRAVNRPLNVDGRSVDVSVSIGFALVPDNSQQLGELQHHSDLALAESKRNGRSQATGFDVLMLRGHHNERLIERELRAALLLDQLTLHYQPLVDRSGNVRGLEALVRWNHPIRGVISPGEFVPVAERSRLIDRLGEWVFRRALHDARDFGDRMIGVNFSPAQLKRDDVVEMVARVLAESGIAPNRVVIELTETVAVNANGSALQRLKALRDLGLRISLDDFGTGYCGFGYLRSFPINSIKIDRSYVQRLGASEADNVLVTALSSVANAMKIAIVAEGIETEEQLLLARAAGCTLFQGYHIARPMPKEAIDFDRLEDRMSAPRQAAG